MEIDCQLSLRAWETLISTEVAVGELLQYFQYIFERTWLSAELGISFTMFSLETQLTHSNIDSQVILPLSLILCFFALRKALNKWSWTLMRFSNGDSSILVHTDVNYQSHPIFTRNAPMQKCFTQTTSILSTRFSKCAHELTLFA